MKYLSNKCQKEGFIFKICQKEGFFAKKRDFCQKEGFFYCIIEKEKDSCACGSDAVFYTMF